MRKLLLLVFLSACNTINITGPTTTNTNTNTNSTNIDIHDVGSFTASPNPTSPLPGTGEVPLSIPPGSQAIAERAVNQNALAHSCQDTYGEAAWLYLDTEVLALQASDARWGYLVKTDGKISRDVIAYRATSGPTGAWGVDIIIDSCGTPKFGWNVIGFDPAATWTSTRFK